VTRLLLATGIVVLAIVWFGPLLTTWRDSFASGMVAHMAVVAIASPLIALGLPSRLRPGPGMPAALPLLASLFELLAVWGWHAPSLRGVAEASVPGTIAEQTTFLLAGVALWLTSFAAPAGRTHAAIGAVALLLTSMHMTLLGALLALSPRPLYGTDDVTCFGLVLDAGQDQQLGGVVMLAVGAVVYLAGGLALVARLVNASNSNVDRMPSSGR